MATAPRSRRPALLALGAAVVLGGVGGLLVAVLTPADFTATAAVLVSSGASEVELGDPPRVDVPLGADYRGVVTSASVLQPVIVDLGLRTTVSALAAHVHATQPDSQPLLRIEVTDASAARAARIANAVQDRFVAEVSTGSAKSLSLRSVQRATAPAAPAGPTTPVLVLIGALGGVLVWALAAIAVLIVRAPLPPGGRPAPSMF
jgi:succinoglycan biosynthesis transport protein ExoP